jgi:hypothetical protein
MIAGVPPGVVGIGAGMAGLKGGALGAALGGGRDTLAKSAAIPAAVVAAAAPVTDMAFEAGGYDNAHVDPVLSAAITGGVGAGGWLMRNWNKKKNYI